MGLYFRYFKWSTGPRWITFTMPLLYPTLLTALLPTLWLLLFWKSRRTARAHGFPIQLSPDAESSNVHH